MRPFVCLLLFAGLAFAQAPTIGTIDFYGLRKTSETRARKALGASEGSPLPASKGDAETRLENLPGVTQAHLEAICCDENHKAILYVGIEEKGANHFNYRDAPIEQVSLPEEIGSTYTAFLQAVGEAARHGKTAEDLTRGHSLMEDEAVRALQLKFADFAAKYTAELRKVMRYSASEEQRAMAAYIIGYAPKKAAVVDDLQYALQDPDDTVRNNAMRSLGAFAVLARKNPESEVKVATTWMVEMLNSIYWGDRHNAAVSLVTLTDNRDEIVLEHLKDRALLALVEMARWKHLEHALPSYILVGRIAGFSETELQKAWSNNERERIIKAALSNKK